MNIEKEIKQLKEEERQNELDPFAQKPSKSNDSGWIVPAVIAVFLIKYFATGSGFNLGALAGYWWLIFFLPLILGWYDD